MFCNDVFVFEMILFYAVTPVLANQSFYDIHLHIILFVFLCDIINVRVIDKHVYKNRYVGKIDCQDQRHVHKYIWEIFVVYIYTFKSPSFVQ